MKIKAGYKTSEFWFTLVSFIFSGLYLTGILSENEHKEQLIEVVSHAVESCILIGGQLIILYKYINGRTKIKEKASKTDAAIDNGDNPDDKPTKHGPHKSGSRKTNPNSKRKTKRGTKSSG